MWSALIRRAKFPEFHCLRSALPALLASGLACAAASCATHHSHQSDSSVTLRSVPVPAGAEGIEDALPQSVRLAEGEAIRRQSYTLDAEGNFTFTRSVETEVGFLGLQKVLSLDPGAAASRKLEPFSGVLVDSVAKDSPAERAGLRQGDVILRFGGKEVKSPDQFFYVADQAAPGEEVDVEFVRDGERRSARATYGSITHIVGSKTFDRKFGVVNDTERSGLMLVEIPADMRPVVLGKNIAEGGLLIVEMLPGGPSFFSDLRLKDFVVAVGGRPVGTAEQYREVLADLRPGERTSVTFRRGDDTIETWLRVREDAGSRSGFNIAGLMKYEGRPHRSHFSLLWGLLCHHNSCHYIRQEGDDIEHRSERDWGMIVDLISYKGRPHRKQLTLAWIFPISFGG